MTTAEMIILFNQRYRKSSPINDDLDDDQLVVLLNSAISKLTNQYYEKYISGKLDAIEDIYTLQATSSITKTTVISSLPNGSVYDFPADYRFHMSALVNVTTYDSSAVNYWVDCDRISVNNIGRFLRNSINLPIIDTPKYVEFQNKIVVLHEGTPEMDTSNLLLHYIKNPLELNSASPNAISDLPLQLHERIVEMALEYAVEPDVPDEQRVQSVNLVNDDN